MLSTLMDEGREEGGCYDELEACLLINSASHEPIFQRIFEKYDREFHATEHGGKILDFSHKARFEAQIKQLFVPEVSKFDESVARSSSSSDGGLSDSEVESRKVFPALAWTKNPPTAILDPVVTQRLHKKVVQIKKEINWDDEERKHRKMLQERKALADLSSSDEEEDFKPHAPFRVPAVPLHEYSSGMESGYLADYVPLDHSRGYEYASGLETKHQLHEECPSGLESGFALEHSDSDFSKDPWSRPAQSCGLVKKDCLSPPKESEDYLSGFESGYLVEEEEEEHETELSHCPLSTQHRKRRRVTQMEVVTSEYQITVRKKRKLCPRTSI